MVLIAIVNEGGVKKIGNYVVKLYFGFISQVKMKVTFYLNLFVGFIPGKIEGCMLEDGIISLLHLDPHRLKKEILDALRDTFDFDLLKLIFFRFGSSESAKTVSHFLMGLLSSWR